MSVGLPISNTMGSIAIIDAARDAGLSSSGSYGGSWKPISRDGLPTQSGASLLSQRNIEGSDGLGHVGSAAPDLRFLRTMQYNCVNRLYTRFCALCMVKSRNGIHNVYLCVALRA